MNDRLRMMGFGLAFLCGSLCSADERPGAHPRFSATCGCCCAPAVAWCPDDYCRKPMPCVPCLPGCGTCDDYCRKPMPCVPRLPCCGTCDDYCRKPFPSFCWPAPRGLVCGPPCSTCSRCSALGR